MITLPDWTTDQWIAFTGVTVAGLAAGVLLAVAVHAFRSWTASATYRATGDPARPSLILAAERHMTEAEMKDFEHRWYEARDRANVGQRIDMLDDSTHAWLAAPAPLVIDPTAAEIAEHLAPGPGSLTSLAEVEGHATERVELVDPEVARWFADAFDRPAHTPGRDEAREVDEGGALARFHAAIEPAMRTARLWRVRGEEGPGVGRRMLNDWRIGTETGEWPIITISATEAWVYDPALVRIP